MTSYYTHHEYRMSIVRVCLSVCPVISMLLTIIYKFSDFVQVTLILNGAIIKFLNVVSHD